MFSPIIIVWSIVDDADSNTYLTWYVNSAGLKFTIVSLISKTGCVDNKPMNTASLSYTFFSFDTTDEVDLILPLSLPLFTDLATCVATLGINAVSTGSTSLFTT